MSEIWVISDTHFNHDNIIQYCGRPFANTELMNEFMVEAWNEVVKPQDKVYHLGDVYMGTNPEHPRSVLSKLNGKKRLILGNHDSGQDENLLISFQKIDVWRMFPEFGLLLTHVPVHESTLQEGRFRERGLLNVHGHIHNNSSPEGPYRCVCVEHIDYRPINIEELRVV